MLVLTATTKVFVFLSNINSINLCLTFWYQNQFSGKKRIYVPYMYAFLWCNKIIINWIEKHLPEPNTYFVQTSSKIHSGKHILFKPLYFCCWVKSYEKDCSTKKYTKYEKFIIYGFWCFVTILLFCVVVMWKTFNNSWKSRNVL